MEVGAWFVQGLPILAKPAPRYPVRDVQIVERGRKIDEEKKGRENGKGRDLAPLSPRFFFSPRFLHVRFNSVPIIRTPNSTN